MSGRGAPPATGHERDVARAVPEVLRVAALDVGDPLPVGAPGGRAVRSGARRDGARDLRPRGPPPRRRRVFCDRSGSGSVRLLTKAIALAVGRPGRVGVVEGARGDLDGGLRLDVEDVDVLAELAQVALAVALELQAAQDDRLRRLLLLARGLLLVVLVRRRRGRRPRRRGRAASSRATRRGPRRRPCSSVSLTASPPLPAQEVDLRLLALAVREERDPLPVRAEARARLAPSCWR